MSPSEAKLDLERRLRTAGFDHAHPDLRIAWSCFREHLHQPVSGVGDSVMAEAGVYSFGFQPFKPAFVLDLCRQFEHRDESGEFDHYEQLHLMLYYDPTSDLSALRMSEFWEEGTSQDAFITAVERQPAFATAVGASCKASLLMQWNV